MITSEGKLHIKRYLAGWTGTLAESIAFGIGTKAEDAEDRRLEFEVGRSDIILTSYDFINDKLIFKATLPDDYEGTVYEVALFSRGVNSVAGEYGSDLLVSFDSDTEDWLNDLGESAGYTLTGSRLGADSLFHNPAASSQMNSYLGDILMDLSGYSGADEFLFAYYVGNGNTANIQIRFMTDEDNYYEFAMGPQTAGYKIISIAKSSALVFGSPKWDEITQVQVTTTSNGNGVSDISFDAIRIEDADTINSDYVMIAREQLSTPFVKQNGKIQEVEFSLDVIV